VSIRLSLSLSVLTLIGHQDMASAQSVPANTGQPPTAHVGSAFPEGARYAYLDLNRVVSLTTDGRATAAKIQEFRKQKALELQGRSKELETLQGKLSSQLLSEAAKAQFQRQFDRARVDFQRLSQDADAAIQEMQDQAERAFFNRLFPVVGQIAKEKSLWAVFTADSPILWHDEKIDISEEVAKRLEAVPAPPPAPATPR
jgi:Skp family chaperone for outer membrane proteins